MTMLPLSKLRSMKFVKNMFYDRGYNVDETSMSTLYDPRQDLWLIQTVTTKGHRVVALFADCKAFGTSEQVNVSELSPPLVFTTLKERDNQSPVLPSSGGSKNTGTDYIKCLIKFAREQKFQVVILVTDFMTPQASKLALKVDGVRMTHFTYDETGIEHMADHITQPLKFQALTGSARKQFIAKNHRYQLELIRYSFDDALVKYHGMVIGDVIYIQDNDRQSGLVEEYGIVVEETT